MMFRSYRHNRNIYEKFTICAFHLTIKNLTNGRDFDIVKCRCYHRIFGFFKGEMERNEKGTYMEKLERAA